jgi:hypothetical protein
MKNSIIVLSLLLGLLETNAIKINILNEKNDSEELSPPAETDLDSLMDKYDDAEKEKDKPKKIQ